MNQLVIAITGVVEGPQIDSKRTDLGVMTFFAESLADTHDGRYRGINGWENTWLGWGSTVSVSTLFAFDISEQSNQWQKS